MSQETVSQRLKILIKSLGLNTRSFSQKYGVNESTTRGYIDRGSVPSADYIGALVATIENLNPMWLLLGRGEMFLTDGSTSQDTSVSAPKNKGHVQTNSGNHNTITNNVTLEECRRDLASAQKEVEMLWTLVASRDALIESKDALIAAKEEVLSLLRGGHNRAN
ncbi:hypothetical protein [Hymenobacter perfusus]|uniref:XRE family transcriptional regulator n=1 Tax=Hymenobacter perfusus TaxID=1236770 RepID=A0A428KE53_9BACT|nr:hypothetical protein [Hymenobacter perfusus]RSK44678.1 hypothetical protein EI293_09210 [Hymenobacter perfusus]